MGRHEPGEGPSACWGEGLRRRGWWVAPTPAPPGVPGVLWFPPGHLQRRSWPCPALVQEAWPGQLGFHFCFGG